jgi:hypothetical protein
MQRPQPAKPPISAIKRDKVALPLCVPDVATPIPPVTDIPEPLHGPTSPAATLNSICARKPATLGPPMTGIPPPFHGPTSPAALLTSICAPDATRPDPFHVGNAQPFPDLSCAGAFRSPTRIGDGPPNKLNGTGPFKEWTCQTGPVFSLDYWIARKSALIGLWPSLQRTRQLDAAQVPE